MIKDPLESLDEMDKMVEEVPKEILDSPVPKAFLVDKEEMAWVVLLALPEPWWKEKKFLVQLGHPAEMVCLDRLVLLD